MCEVKPVHISLLDMGLVWFGFLLLFFSNVWSRWNIHQEKLRPTHSFVKHVCICLTSLSYLVPLLRLHYLDKALFPLCSLPFICWFASLFYFWSTCPNTCGTVLSVWVFFINVFKPLNILLQFATQILQHWKSEHKTGSKKRIAWQGLFFIVHDNRTAKK